MAGSEWQAVLDDESSLSERVGRAIGELRRPGRRRYRLGVLFVHGMGEQSRGDTLTEAGDALVQWLERWCEKPPPGTALGKGDVHVLDASLRSAHDDELSTAHLVLRLTLPVAEPDGSADETKELHWVLAESWWAEGFRQASFNQVASWAVGIGPWVLATQFHGIRDRMEMPAEAPWPLRWLLWPAAILTMAALVAAAVLLSLLLTLLAIVVLVLALIPIGPVQAVAAGVQRSLASSFGDLMVLVKSPGRFGAMRSQVQRDVAALSRACDQVAVIAHSQGSHIAWEAIRRPAPEADRVPANLVRFVTYGQAMRKLKLAYELSRHELDGGIAHVAGAALAAQIALALLVAAGISALLDGGALIASVSGWIEERARVDGLTQLASLVILVLYGNAALLERGRIETEHVEETVSNAVERATKGRHRFRWIDLWASADPAPNGPLFRTAVPPVESWRIRNTGSILLDHSIYWQNTSEFVGAVGLELGRLGAAGTAHFPGADDPFPSRRLRLAALTRGARVQVLTGLRVLWIGAALALGLHLFAPLLVAVQLPWLATIPGLDWLGDWLPPVIALALLAVGGLAGWVILAKLWAVGTTSDDRTWFKGELSGPFPPSALIAVALLLIVPAAVAFALWQWLDAGVTALVYLLAAPLIAMAANSFISGGGRALADVSPASRIHLPIAGLMAALVTALIALGVVGLGRPELDATATSLLGWTAYGLLLGPLAWATLRRWRGFVRRHRALRDEVARIS